MAIATYSHCNAVDSAAVLEGAGAVLATHAGVGAPVLADHLHEHSFSLVAPLPAEIDRLVGLAQTTHAFRLSKTY